MFLEDDGRVTVVAADGVYHLAANERDGGGAQFMGLELPFGASSFQHVGPKPRRANVDAFRRRPRRTNRQDRRLQR